MASAELAWLRFRAARRAPATSAGSAVWRAARAGLIAANKDEQLAERAGAFIKGELSGTERAWRAGKASDRLFGELLRRIAVDPGLEYWREQQGELPWADVFERAQELQRELAEKSL